MIEPDQFIDLRSDTVTRPSPAMRAAMTAAEVGDDQYGEDPTVNALQARVARLLGKQAALWLPSGTMANQVALRVLTRPGDDVMVSRESHAVWHETGGGAANSGDTRSNLAKIVPHRRDELPASWRMFIHYWRGEASRTASSRAAGTAVSRATGTWKGITPVRVRKDGFVVRARPRSHDRGYALVVAAVVKPRTSDCSGSSSRLPISPSRLWLKP